MKTWDRITALRGQTLFTFRGNLIRVWLWGPPVPPEPPHPLGEVRELRITPTLRVRDIWGSMSAWEPLSYQAGEGRWRSCRSSTVRNLLGLKWYLRRWPESESE